MFLKYLSLQNFRSYTKSEFNFSSKTAFIVGSNTSGKTNLIEAIYLLSTGKSFRAEKDLELIKFNESISRIKGSITQGVILGTQSEAWRTPESTERTDSGQARMTNTNQSTELEVLLVNQANTFSKKYLVNGVSRRRVDFSANLITVLFQPENLDIIIGSPSLRRGFLNNVLEQVDRDYRLAITTYEKTLRQRNALLDVVRGTWKRSDRQFEYWDEILIKNGEIITRKREELIEFLNLQKKDIFDFAVIYDKSIISEERLSQYKEAEVGAGVTLVGPHRDDMKVQSSKFKVQSSNGDTAKDEFIDIKSFGSRGQQRLAILQLKLLELEYIEKKLEERPAFLLDDIFSELDENHISHILKMVNKQQTIITTTHKEFVPQSLLDKAQVIELTK